MLFLCSLLIQLISLSLFATVRKYNASTVWFGLREQGSWRRYCDRYVLTCFFSLLFIFQIVPLSALHKFVDCRVLDHLYLVVIDRICLILLCILSIILCDFCLRWLLNGLLNGLLSLCLAFYQRLLLSWLFDFFDDSATCIFVKSLLTDGGELRWIQRLILLLPVPYLFLF